MQQLKNKQENEILKKEVENNIILTNRKQIKLSGIEEVLSSNYKLWVAIFPLQNLILKIKY